MGASSFVKVTVGKYANAQEAYRALCEQARHEFGNRECNGTISTTNGFRDLTYKAPRYGSKAWHDFVEDQIEATEKWGPCVCVQLTGTALKQLKLEAGIKEGERGNRAFVFLGWVAE